MNDAPLELLTASKVKHAEQAAATELADGTYTLMERASQAVYDLLLARLADAGGFDVLCGPGNNGGDGYVVARLAAQAGLDVDVYALGQPKPHTDAARAFAAWDRPIRELAEWEPRAGRVVVDALFGSGISRDLEGNVLAAVSRANAAGSLVVAIDLPTGIEADTGQVLGAAFEAAITVSLFRYKPGHVMAPGRLHCGEVILRDIGMDARHLDQLQVDCRLNAPELWQHAYPWPSQSQHKYSRGHVGVFGGGPMTSGAARLSAMAAARAGAGAVTLLSPANALLLYAMHLTSVMVTRLEDRHELDEFLAKRHPQVFVLGPGFGAADKVRVFVADLLGADLAIRPNALVLDADGLTAFEGDPQQLFDLAEAFSGNGGTLVLTPHLGEFRRIFPDLEGSPLELARQAAERAKCVVLLKGSDTVIADPAGQTVINSAAPAWLATAGSGDVLSGIIASLLAQGMTALDAAGAATWLHAKAAEAFGPGLMAEDLPDQLPSVLRRLWRTRQDHLLKER
ncbi:bifunctional ADP-dependent NAD(P)H-hydrate dehydratase/NAD(P)H-hydrate epimerase [Nitratireductor basaltis]|uniref:Bifunctional NAD(P)H-hydrate repair enzyme n=1 Tax=Nitratireductor basaltis TaxID=472175 RepID=A0A084UAU9_9HYPH|nr:bifunctional ADP-dependent NAD(P)H-hydrate dehydratase/NAD(P)H-hydrate epimerase [Nitratireductor basaltis]KFB10085.1 Carbohydrate kinase, YjeF related protein [Nitratireductor basaltis]